MIFVRCISLVDQLERRGFMRKQLDACGFSYEFSNAICINPNNGFPDIYNRKRRLNYVGVDMSFGEMGCYLSHRLVWQEFLASKEEICLVLEDDVELHADFPDVIDRLCEMKGEWEFVRLSSTFKRRFFPKTNLGHGYYLGDYLAQPNGTPGYLINRYAADVLLGCTSSMWHAIDNTIDRDWVHGLRMMGVEPNIVVHQTYFPSTVFRKVKSKIPWYKKIRREFFRGSISIRKSLWIIKKWIKLIL